LHSSRHWADAGLSSGPSVSSHRSRTSASCSILSAIPRHSLATLALLVPSFLLSSRSCSLFFRSDLAPCVRHFPSTACPCPQLRPSAVSVPISIWCS
jgi:hypothetical protein